MTPPGKKKRGACLATGLHIVLLPRTPLLREFALRSLHLSCQGYLCKVSLARGWVVFTKHTLVNRDVPLSEREI